MTAVFGTLFNDLVVPRFHANGDVKELHRVPISYGPKEKVLAMTLANPTLEMQSAVATLPRISFEMTSTKFDPERMLNPIQTVTVSKDATTHDYKHQFQPVPYNWNYSLWVYAKDIEDGNKIVEQILPFFKPEFPVKVDLIPEMEVSVNVPVVLNSVTPSDTYEGDFITRRILVWTFDFTMKGYYFGPITQDKVIKFANVNFYVPPVADLTSAVGNSTPLDRVTSQPGLTANGEPTTNVALTIPYQQIDADDPYGYINIIYGNLDPTEGTGGNQSNNLPTVP